MMMNNSLLLGAVVMGIIAILIGIVRFQQRKIKKQEQQIQQEKADKRALSVELKNAKTKQNVEESNRTLSASDVDERLQSANYFRNDE
ncbi:DUF2681 domain-containing protein [Pasteurella multocida subsp. multocida]|uniref:DUF2681 domain-containing protein n=1 Tax=Pasteurella multocida TaxID=747 RepID=A0A9X3URE2_PASMD|nr:DUF2681 domain-containing protein [Pasteurella multocida]MBF6981564.1 DUF2681 domain-containing protein [Pasteurella multocida]MDA5611565.1 DUF2681 domain-containing protein [Pasteurella multocida]MDA5614007.1 DUF2681 domain-containing protein [Pasteurella multocida]MDA5618978.1 DUF2681 domain-containing protein [Pasteurella multocida subsp. multocida]MDA5621844.1 DUF2681 domain-containing protein [Pasteurella multocida subsp. multocida]